MALPEGLAEFSLDGKVALVIGAERAVGRAAAQALAEAGANVMVASQDAGTEAALKDAAKLVHAAGRKAVTRVQSAVIRADLSATIDLAVKELGALDILVNALDLQRFGPAESLDDNAFEEVLEGNLKTVWMACQEAARVMLQRGGAIVNICTILGERGIPGGTLYCAAKAAVINLTRAFALEWARRGIRVNALEAGWMDEEGSPASKETEFGKGLLKYLPDNRLIKPEELGGALLYLVCPAAGFVTGESIVVDGALLCRV